MSSEKNKPGPLQTTVEQEDKQMNPESSERSKPISDNVRGEGDAFFYHSEELFREIGEVAASGQNNSQWLEDFRKEFNSLPETEKQALARQVAYNAPLEPLQIDGKSVSFAVDGHGTPSKIGDPDPISKLEDLDIVVEVRSANEHVAKRIDLYSGTLNGQKIDEQQSTAAEIRPWVEAYFLFERKQMEQESKSLRFILDRIRSGLPNALYEADRRSQKLAWNEIAQALSLTNKDLIHPVSREIWNKLNLKTEITGSIIGQSGSDYSRNDVAIKFELDAGVKALPDNLRNLFEKTK